MIPFIGNDLCFAWHIVMKLTGYYQQFDIAAIPSDLTETIIEQTIAEHQTCFYGTLWLKSHDVS